MLLRCRVHNLSVILVLLVLFSSGEAEHDDNQYLKEDVKIRGSDSNDDLYLPDLQKLYKLLKKAYKCHERLKNCKCRSEVKESPKQEDSETMPPVSKGDEDSNLLPFEDPKLPNLDDNPTSTEENDTIQQETNSYYEETTKPDSTFVPQPPGIQVKYEPTKGNFHVPRFIFNQIKWPRYFDQKRINEEEEANNNGESSNKGPISRRKMNNSGETKRQRIERQKMEEDEESRMRMDIPFKKVPVTKRKLHGNGESSRWINTELSRRFPPQTPHIILPKLFTGVMPKSREPGVKQHYQDLKKFSMQEDDISV